MRSLRNIYEKIQFGVGVMGSVLREYAYENTGLKLIALLIAVVLWASVEQEIIQVTLQQVPLDYINLSEGLAISNDDFPKVANVRLRGPKLVLDRLRAETLPIQINLRSIKVGERALPISRNDVLAPPEVEVLDIEPQRARLMIEPIIERKVKVTPRFADRVPQDYEVTQILVNPSMVTIRGPESRVNAIADAPSETIRLNGHRKTFIERPNINIEDLKIEIVGSPSIEVQVEIGQIRTERKLTKVPLRIPQSDGKISLSPITVNVTVEGLKSVVESLTLADIAAFIDIENIPNTGVATPRIVLPPDKLDAITVKSVEPQQIQIKRLR
ncbi:MAG: CdaR family protein [Acidobacteriota bacterium]